LVEKIITSNKKAIGVKVKNKMVAISLDALLR